MSGLEDLRKRARELALKIIRAAAERRRVAARIGEEKIRAGHPIENPSIEAELWEDAVREALGLGLDARTAGRIIWLLIEDSLRAQGALTDAHDLAELAEWASIDPEAVRLDVDYWESLETLDTAGVTGSLTIAEKTLLESLAGRFQLNTREYTLASFQSVRDAVETVLEALGEGRGHVFYGPIHPWVVRASWRAGGRPYIVRRRAEKCWELEEPAVTARSWLVLVEQPDYNTGQLHAHARLKEIAQTAERRGLLSIAVEYCQPMLGPESSALGVFDVVVGSADCVLGGLGRSPAWIVADKVVARRIKRIRAEKSLEPKPAALVSVAKLMASGEQRETIADAVSGRARMLRDVLGGRVYFCEPKAPPHVFLWGINLSLRDMLALGVFLAPGRSFGVEGYRLNFMVGEDELALGLGRLILGLSRL